MSARRLLIGVMTLGCFVVSGCSSVSLKKPQSLPDYSMAVTTEDGWRLSLFRREAQGQGVHGTPVLLVPSIGMNRMAFTSEGSDLAEYLSLQGFDVWLLDVRGSVSSRAPDRSSWAKPSWTYSDLLEHDVPAAVEAITSETGQPGVAWVGHGLGAHLGAQFAASHPGQITTLVGLGLTGDCAHPTRSQLHASDGFGLALGGERVPLRSIGRLVSMTLHLAPDTPMLHSLFNEANVSAEVVASLAAGGLEDIRAPLLDELAVWCGEGQGVGSSFAGDFGAPSVPALFVAGRVDALAPPWAVQAAWERWESADKQFVVLGEGWGQAQDYGHLDLVLGDGVRDEVFPLILDWLGAARPSGDAARGGVPKHPDGEASEAAQGP